MTDKATHVMTDNTTHVMTDNVTHVMTDNLPSSFSFYYFMNYILRGCNKKEIITKSANISLLSGITLGNFSYLW